MNDSKLSLTDYSLACFQCGKQDKVSLIPQRNNDDHVVGIFVLCKKCYTVFAGGTVKTQFIKPSKSKVEAEISASSNNRSAEIAGRIESVAVCLDVPGKKNRVRNKEILMDCVAQLRTVR